MLSKLLRPEILELIEEKNWKILKDALTDWPSPDIADLLENVPEKDSLLLFRFLHKKVVSEVFSELRSSRQETLLRGTGNTELKQLIAGIPPDDRTELLEDLPGAITQKILNLLPTEERKEALELLGYPEKSVGRLMTPEYVGVRPHWNIEKAIQHIRQLGRDAETIDIVYVTDSNWKLLDDVPIRKFILANSEQRITEIMDNKFIAIDVNEDQESAYQLMKKYDLNVLPVVDSEGTLIGIVTVDDILDVLEEEVTEDVQKASAIIPVEESYSFASPFLLYKKRVTWLILLLIADFLSSNVIAHFEHTLTAIIVLAFFIPILIDSGGNTAAQSSTLVIRAIATGELTLKKWFSVIKKELVVGMLLSITLGVFLYLLSCFWRGGSQVGLVTGLSMIAIVLWANLLGSLLPIILTKFKLDPAVTSSPLLTTVVDSTGLFIYFSLANSVFHIA